MVEKFLLPEEPEKLRAYIKRICSDQSEMRKSMDNILAIIQKWAPKGLAAASHDLEFVQCVNLFYYLTFGSSVLSKENDDTWIFANKYATQKDFFTPLLSLYDPNEKVQRLYGQPFNLASEMNQKIFYFLFRTMDAAKIERAKTSNDPKMMELYAVSLNPSDRAKLYQHVFWHYDARQYSIASSAEKFNGPAYGIGNNVALKQNFSTLYEKMASEQGWVYTALAADCFSRIDGSFYAMALERMIESYEKDDFKALSKLSAVMMETGFNPQGDWTDMISGVPKSITLVFNSNARLFTRLVMAMSDGDKKIGFEKVLNIIIEESDERMWKFGMAILTQCLHYENSHYGGAGGLVQSKLFSQVVSRSKAKLQKKKKLDWVKSLLEKNKSDPTFGDGAKYLLDALKK